MANTSDYSILAVDDTDIILELLKNQLENEGYHVATALNGDAAKKLLAKATFDLIMLDIEMPDISGVELLKFIRAEGNNMNTPVIMLTAQNDPNSVKECLGNGAKDYVLKPFNMVSVKQRIWKVLQQN